MNHLQEAKSMATMSGGDNYYDNSVKLGILHALIAIAEREENLGYEIRLLRESLEHNLAPITEQLEKMNNNEMAKHTGSAKQAADVKLELDELIEELPQEDKC